MLKLYKDYLEKKNIPYFWNTKNNLLATINESTLDNYKFKLNKIINTIDKQFENQPEIMTKYICKY